MRPTWHSQYITGLSLTRVHRRACCLLALATATIGVGCNSSSTPTKEGNDRQSDGSSASSIATPSEASTDPNQPQSHGSTSTSDGGDADGEENAESPSLGSPAASGADASAHDSVAPGIDASARDPVAPSRDASAHDPDPSSSIDAGSRDVDVNAPAEGSSIDGGAKFALLEQARADYRSWEPRTDAPVHISADIFSLCRTPSASEDAFVESVHGEELALQDWLNPAALETLAAFEAATTEDEAAPSFPVGATIVKEKLVGGGGEYELAALGFMIKREPGFDAANADWQFGYWDARDGMSSSAEEQASCGACHAFSATDFVYLDASWRLP